MDVPTTPTRRALPPALSAPARRTMVAVAVVASVGMAACGELQPIEWSRASSTTTSVEVDLSTTTMPGAGTVGEPRRARYTVQPGDTLSSIATRFGVTQQSLLAANMLEDPNNLEAGMELRIPGPNATTPPPWLQEGGSQWGGQG